jgi:hypothetical protein
MRKEERQWRMIHFPYYLVGGICMHADQRLRANSGDTSGTLINLTIQITIDQKSTPGRLDPCDKYAFHFLLLLLSDAAHLLGIDKISVFSCCTWFVLKHDPNSV